MSDLNVQDLMDFLKTSVDIKTIGEAEKGIEQKPKICPSCKKEYIPDENIELQNKCPLCGVTLTGEGEEVEVLGDKDLGVPTVESKLEENNNKEELNVGCKVKILRGSYKGQVGKVLDFTVPGQKGEDKQISEYGKVIVKTDDGKTRYLDWYDVELVEKVKFDVKKSKEKYLSQRRRIESKLQEAGKRKPGVTKRHCGRVILPSINVSEVVATYPSTFKETVEIIKDEIFRLMSEKDPIVEDVDDVEEKAKAVYFWIKSAKPELLENPEIIRRNVVLLKTAIRHAEVPEPVEVEEESKLYQCMSCAKVFKAVEAICPECKEKKEIETLGEDVTTIEDPKIRRMFTKDKVEGIDKSIKRINVIIQQCEKEQKRTKKFTRGYELQRLYNKVDELEHEKARLLKTIESKLREQEKETRTIIAKGIVDKTEADRIATSKKGVVVQDDEDNKKFMVIVKED